MLGDFLIGALILGLSIQGYRFTWERVSQQSGWQSVLAEACLVATVLTAILGLGIMSLAIMDKLNG